MFISRAPRNAFIYPCGIRQRNFRTVSPRVFKLVLFVGFHQGETAGADGKGFSLGVDPALAFEDENFMLHGVGVVGGVPAGLHFEQTQVKIRCRRILAQQPADGHVFGSGHGDFLGRHFVIIFNDHGTSLEDTCVES